MPCCDKQTYSQAMAKRQERREQARAELKAKKADAISKRKEIISQVKAQRERERG